MNTVILVHHKKEDMQYIFDKQGVNQAKDLIRRLLNEQKIVFVTLQDRINNPIHREKYVVSRNGVAKR